MWANSNSKFFIQKNVYIKQTEHLRYVILMLYRHLEQTDPQFVSLLKTKTIQTELEYSGESLSYGFLVNEKDDYDFFVDFVQVGHG